MESISSGTSTEQTQQVGSATQDTQTDKDASVQSDFEQFLKGILPSSTDNTISEEDLFAALIQERVKSLKGDDAATKFSELFAEKKTSMTKADGYVPVEDAAKAALKELVSSEDLTGEEAGKIYSHAFAGAQLDDNTEALFDGRGGADDTTIAVDTMEAALLAARVQIEKFDAGEEPTARDLDEESMSKAAAMAAGGGTATAAGNGESSSGVALDGANGFLFKPESDSNGNLVVLLPEVMTGNVLGISLKGENDEVLEEGAYGGVGNGEREHFRFSQPGGNYPANLIVEVAMKDGSTKTYEIADPSQRYD